MIALKDSLGSEFVERVRAFFSENGPLSKAANFEFRPQQQEMAAAVAFLASDDSSFMTASTFLVDGGISGAYVTPL